MSNFNSTQFSNSLAAPVVTPAPPIDQAGRKRILYASYTTPASAGPAAGDFLICFRIPKGARLTSVEVIVPASFVTSSAKFGYGSIDATTGTVTVTGTSTDDDRWGSGKDLSSAGRIQFLATAADLDYKTTAEVVGILGFVTGNPGASKQIGVLAEYVLD